MLLALFGCYVGAPLVGALMAAVILRGETPKNLSCHSEPQSGEESQFEIRRHYIPQDDEV